MRQPRDKRRAGVRVTLTARDEALLRALGRFRIARSSDVGRLFFEGRNRDVQAARLRKLFDGHFVEVHAPERAAENIYSLGREGKAWLRARGIEARSIPRPPWGHHLGIVGFWARAATAVRRVAGLRLSRFIPDWECRERGATAGLGFEPDALVELTLGGGDSSAGVRLVVELDRATESLETLRRKVRAISDARAVGGSVLTWTDFELCVVLDAEGARREEAVRSLVAVEWVGEARVWTEASDLTVEFSRRFGIAVPPVTDSRRGNGSTRGLSPRGTEPAGVTGGGHSDHE